MPIFMDRHIVPGIEAQDAANAHKADLEIQDNFGCRCMTYWVDEERGSAFCLIDAPDEDAVKKMHDKAHGLIPHEIIQVNSNVVEAFLGRISDPDGHLDPSQPGLKIFNDPAFRIILVTETTDVRLLQYRLGKQKANQLIGLYHDIMRKQLQIHEGREVELKGEGFVASFVSVTLAISCMIAIQNGMHVAGELINLRMGLNAGMPVTKDRELFGETIKIAKYLIQVGSNNQMVMAPIIREIYKEDGNKNLALQDSMKWITPIEENFLILLMDTLSIHWSDPEFGVQDFADKMSMSKSKLYRNCIELTGNSPNELLREYRLLKSLNTLRTDRNITQSAFEVGFSGPSYFTKCFQQRFGLSPLAYHKLES